MIKYINLIKIDYFLKYKIKIFKIFLILNLNFIIIL